MDYKNLNLDRNKIAPTIQEYCKDCDIREEAGHDGKPTTFSVICSGQKPALLQVFFKTDGTTTLHPKVGKNPEFSEQIAAYVVKHCKQISYDASNLVLDSISEKDFGLLKEYLADGGYNLRSKQLDQSEQIEVTGPSGDRVVIHRYHNARFMMQGRPLASFAEVVSLLCELVPNRSIIESQLKCINANVSVDEVLAELRLILPTAYPFLGEKLHAILSPAIALRKISVSLSDYSAFAFPALRGLEGYLKMLFSKHGIEIKSVVGFGNQFNQYSLKPGVRIECPRTRTAIERCYKYYSEQRHGLMHTDEKVQMSRVIEFRNEADAIVHAVFSLLEGTYKDIKSGETT